MTTAETRTHNGRPIVDDKIEIRQTGGEFSKDMLVANIDQLLDTKQGDELVLAVRVVCVDEHYPVQDRKEPADGGFIRKLIFDSREVTIVDETVVARFFDEQRDRVQRAQDEAEGQTTVDSQLLVASHEAGEHSAGLVDGCIECDKEAALEAAGD